MMYITSDTSISKLPEKYRFVIVTFNEESETPDDFGMVFEGEKARDAKLAELRADKKQFMSFAR